MPAPSPAILAILAVVAPAFPLLPSPIIEEGEGSQCHQVARGMRSCSRSSNGYAWLQCLLKTLKKGEMRVRR